MTYPRWSGSPASRLDPTAAPHGSGAERGRAARLGAEQPGPAQRGAGRRSRRVAVAATAVPDPAGAGPPIERGGLGRGAGGSRGGGL
ncbi:unnamed protein product [Rangifer tarandus platyrhynchus]|uniref:Uncharacterized protein n=2 Tax=Rangifer tarandus platyrhynchus TaxID=3082113 RepID=A0ACB0EZA0_RANTA|nr:unnamed protein product [Rangifer tarandus platyrhynchus]CAI9705913.1 unnamed protein product [Rangifer tarandus platyrhynchus]